MWVSRDGLACLPFGQRYATYREMAIAFAGSYPRPAEVFDPVIAGAYDAQEATPFRAAPSESSDGQPNASDDAPVHR